MGENKTTTRIKGRNIYFDEELHRYTDDLDNVYTSTTTLIGKYHEDFNTDMMAEICERIGKNPKHPKYLKYKGKTKKQLLYEWKAETERACNQGTVKHNFLETTIKNANNYNGVNKVIVNRLYTIDDILVDHKFGIIELEYFDKSGIKEKYPDIYKDIVSLSKQGFRFYAEIGVYSSEYLISGMIDLLAVRNDTFIIIDWKTNKAPIRFEAGYYDKDNNGNMLDRFIYTDKYMLDPISHLADSTGIHYTLQLSIYANLVESFGFKCLGILIFHIRTVGEKEEVVKVPIKYDGASAIALFTDHKCKLELNKQSNMFKH